MDSHEPSGVGRFSNRSWPLPFRSGCPPWSPRPNGYHVRPAQELAARGYTVARVYRGGANASDFDFLLEIIGKPGGRATLRLERPKWTPGSKMKLSLSKDEWEHLQHRVDAWP